MDSNQFHLLSTLTKLSPSSLGPSQGDKVFDLEVEDLKIKPTGQLNGWKEAKRMNESSPSLYREGLSGGGKRSTNAVLFINNVRQFN